MTLSRNLGLVAALGTCWLLGAACSDDTTARSPGPDAAPEASAGGSAGSGSGGKAATGGRAGSGTGGASGAGAGGKAGTSGASGVGTGGGGVEPDAATDGGGAPSTTTDASLKDGAGPDAKGMGREAEAAVPVARQCTYSCQTDDDCLAGEDATHKCDPVKKRCVNPLEVCSTNDDCVGLANQSWFPPCTSDDDCLTPGDVCIDAGGYGLCATPPDPDLGCLFPGTEPISRHRFDTADAGTITVCGSTAGRCTGGRCIIGCTSMDTFCTDPGGFGPTCNATTGLCECAASGECTASGVSTCNTGSHTCECADGADCTAEGKDTCVAGTCGCSGPEACPASLFKNATPVCE